MQAKGFNQIPYSITNKTFCVMYLRMKHYILFACLLLSFVGSAQIDRATPLSETNAVTPTHTPGAYSSKLVYSATSGKIFLYNGSAWDLIGFTDLSNIPAGLIDGDDDTQLDQAGVKAFVDAEYPNLDTDATDDFDGAFGSLTGVPSGLSDGDDDTQLTQEQVQDLFAALLTGNTETRITVTYDDVGNVLNFVVDLPDWNDLQNIPANLDLDATDDFDGAFSSLSGIPAGLSDGDDTGTDDQTASEVSVSPTGNLNSTDVQAALVEHQADIDALASGAADGVAQSGFYDAVNEEIDIVMAAPGSNFSIDVAGIVQVGQDTASQIRSDLRKLAYTADFGDLDNIPTGLSDGDDVGITSESDPTVGAHIKAITVGDISNWDNDLVDDADNSVTNELQTISKVGSTVTLSNSGGSFTDDDTQLTEEQVEDYVAGMFVGLQSGVTIAYNDPANYFTVTLEQESVEDFVAGLLASSGGVGLTYDDVANTLTVSYTESDPVFSASDAFSITSTQITNWDNAFSWGDHSLAGYALASSVLWTDNAGTTTSANPVYVSANAEFRSDNQVTTIRATGGTDVTLQLRADEGVNEAIIQANEISGNGIIGSHKWATSNHQYTNTALGPHRHISGADVDFVCTGMNIWNTGETLKMLDIGETIITSAVSMTFGSRIVSTNAVPTNGPHLTNKTYVDGLHASDADQSATNEIQTLSQVLLEGNSAGSTKITGLASGTSSGDAVHYGQLSAVALSGNYADLNDEPLVLASAGNWVLPASNFYLSTDNTPTNYEFRYLSGSKLESKVLLDMNGQAIQEVLNPANAQDAATKDYVDNFTGIVNYTPFGGSAISGTLNETILSGGAGAAGAYTVTETLSPAPTTDAIGPVHIEIISGTVWVDNGTTTEGYQFPMWSSYNVDLRIDSTGQIIIDYDGLDEIVRWHIKVRWY